MRVAPATFPRSANRHFLYHIPVFSPSLVFSNNNYFFSSLLALYLYTICFGAGACGTRGRWSETNELKHPEPLLLFYSINILLFYFSSIFYVVLFLEVAFLYLFCLDLPPSSGSPYVPPPEGDFPARSVLPSALVLLLLPAAPISSLALSFSFLQKFLFFSFAFAI